MQLENPEVASSVTHPSSKCTHPRLLPDPMFSPLDDTLVGRLAHPLAGPLAAPQRLLLERFNQRV